MFGFECYGTKYYGDSVIGLITQADFSSVTISISDIYGISMAQTDIYNITISLTGSGS